MPRGPRMWDTNLGAEGDAYNKDTDLKVRAAVDGFVTL